MWEQSEVPEVVNPLNVENEWMYSAAFRADEETTEGSN